ncbi:MAG: alpha/beta fold hydrolase [Desulfuromonadales bacterium]|nr:alpha/beta fold hydrolase [Desulfuromonadales bacterium]
MKFFSLPGGRRLAWREAGVGRPLVLLHGWSMSSAVFTEALEHLSADFRVLAPDLRGHGDSEGGEGYLLTDFAADLARWLQGLELEDVGAVGWSLGGQVLLELLGTPAAERITRIVLVGSTPRFAAAADWSAGLPELQVRAMARDLRRGYLKAMVEFFALQFAGEELPPRRRQRIVEFAVRQGKLPEPPVALAALETLRVADQRQSLAAIAQPVLVVQGGLDRIVAPAAGEWLATRLAQGRLALLPLAGHAPFLSRPEEVFTLWRDFLR